MLQTLEQVVGSEPLPPHGLNPLVPRDLETICLKCLHKEPAQRYDSAAELAEELRRFLAGEPIEARPADSLERAWRWCRRNPVVAALLALVATTLVLGAAVASGLAVWALGERDRANDETHLAQDNEQRALKAEKHAEEEARKARDEERQKDRQLTRAEGLLYAAQLERAQQRWEHGNAGAAADLLDSARWDYRGFEHRHLHSRFNASHLTFTGHTGWVRGIAFSPDGTRLVSGSYDQTVKVWDAHTGQQLLELKGHPGQVSSVAFSPDGRCLASGSADKTVKVWDAHTGQQLLTLKGHTSYVTSVAFSPDSKRIASGAGYLFTNSGR
jgi:hypothetical protein